MKEALDAVGKSASTISVESLKMMQRKVEMRMTTQKNKYGRKTEEEKVSSEHDDAGKTATNRKRKKLQGPFGFYRVIATRLEFQRCLKLQVHRKAILPLDLDTDHGSTSSTIPCMDMLERVSHTNTRKRRTKHFLILVLSSGQSGEERCQSSRC